MRSLTLLATLALVCLFGNTSAAVIQRDIFVPEVVGNGISVLKDAKTDVNVDHNQAGNGNKVDLRKRAININPVV
ncbi:hypothetical protein G6F51_014788 [Rhizopus arrhizus]|uniref:RxLR effector protein n=1 Tax=Rhizopus oryzae TaxID=64495 RepID=A0A9P6XLS8_RHIOR|nr:hypothetical protein G6F51_014788 [Rhizopus arrhizus]